MEIYNETTTKIPHINFEKLRNQILGKDFELSISVLHGKNSKKINWKQRRKKYVPNTLSFKYGPGSGEIILTPEIIAQENYELAGKEIKRYEDKFLYLVIHSMIHLTDLDHGPKMDKLEVKFYNKFLLP